MVDPSPETHDSEPRRAGHRLFWWTIAIGVVVVLADQLSKWWAVSALSGSGRVALLGDLLGLQLVYNPGAAFSTGTGVTWVFTIVTGVVAVLLVWLAWRVGSTVWAVGLGLVLGGAATHFGDRLLRPPAFGQGHVVDFIAYANFFIGNVADIAIVVGVVILFIAALRGIPLRAPDGAAAAREGEDADAAPEGTSAP
ncbi:signal peptidase II [Compostimonas suwonensis]|uniref:Lipoprotein signal peptidase n=1 Tax=Compostimonas suwonensis TaxID=1048394 RepID=A0A2M9C083_9MICO|nr:signal peptidase II [Compostimonas suwonensis]PJJ63732.1 signal peptidase II [Compostimonas suwonensis]